MNDLTALAALPLFRGIAPQDLEAMLTCLGTRRRRFPKGAFLLLMDEQVHCIGVVLSGQVRMLREDGHGNTTLLTVIRPGELFGETFACGSSRTAAVSFQAAAATEVLFLPFAKVMHTCKLTCVFHHRLIENMVGLIADKNLQLMEKAEITAQKTLRGKILAYLTFQADRQGGPYVVSPMGRTELADYLCADRCALTRELSRMQREGLIDYEKNTFRLL